jgi:hypothetical protein
MFSMCNSLPETFDNSPERVVFKPAQKKEADP